MLRQIIFCLFWVPALFAKIVEIKNIEEIQQYLEADMLIIFDLDNTLVETTQTLGSDQWFGYRIEELKKRGFSSEEAGQVALAEWITIQNFTNVRPVEPSTIALLNDLQRNNWKILAVTARGDYLALRTIEQLDSLKIDLSKTAPLKKEVIFDRERHIIYRKGILFTSGLSKGLFLQRLLEENNIKPTKILFVDDKESHLKTVEKMCQENKITFLGLRYGFLDQKVKQFSQEIAQIQWEQFGKLISDQEAKKLMH